jgi:hypothetical protein
LSHVYTKSEQFTKPGSGQIQQLQLIKHKKAVSAGTEPTAFYRHSGGTHEEALSVQLDDRPNNPLKVRKRTFCDAILY